MIPKENIQAKMHSAPVPKTYKEATNALKSFLMKTGTLKTIIYSGNFRNKTKLLPMVSNIASNYDIIKETLVSMGVLENNTKFDHCMAVVLASEIFRRRKKLEGICTPILIINQYADDIINKLSNVTLNDVSVKKINLPKYVRINTLLKSPKSIYEGLKSEGWERIKYKDVSYDEYLEIMGNLEERSFMKDYHVANLLVFHPSASFFNTELYDSHSIIIQDKASCLPAYLSGVQPDWSIIDACAAPGNKTSHMYAIVKGQGQMTANDKNTQRCERMKKFLGEKGVDNIEILNKDFTDVNPSDYADCDFIMIDPSCSASGTGRMEDSSDIDLTRMKKLSIFQFEILSHALKFPGVKAVMYSTCSIHEIENEKVIERALKNFGSDFVLEDLGSKLAGWKHFGLEQYPFGSSCIRTNTDVDRCQGFFVAKFVRREDKEESASITNEIKNEESTVEKTEDQKSVSPIKKKKKKKKQREDEESFIAINENSDEKLDDDDDSVLPVKGEKRKKEDEDCTSATKKKKKKQKKIE